MCSTCTITIAFVPGKQRSGTKASRPSRDISPVTTNGCVPMRSQPVAISRLTSHEPAAPLDAADAACSSADEIERIGDLEGAPGVISVEVADLIADIGDDRITLGFDLGPLG